MTKLSHSIQIPGLLLRQQHHRAGLLETFRYSQTGCKFC